MTEGYRWLNANSFQFLQRDYLLPGQSVDERVSIIASKAEEILGMSGFADSFKENMKKGWYALSTPIWTNFGTNRALPISCFGSFCGDSVSSILETVSEVGMMSKMGGGTSAYFGKIRPRGAPISSGGKSNGPVSFLSLYQAAVNTISQNSVRRGSFAAYLDVEHADIMEFLAMRDEGNPIQDLSFGVCIGDAWMREMLDGDSVKRKIWARIIECRVQKGYPYIFFRDTVDRAKPEVYKDKELTIYGSNLCSEIGLSTSPDESFVCDISSMNLLHYDEWKNTNAVELLVYFLDAVMSEFIEKAKKIPMMNRAVKFAENQRALGLGVLGWHSFLQSKSLPFGSSQAMYFNEEIFRNLREKTSKASKDLAVIYGEPPLLKGYGRRNATLMAIPPTKSSAFILGQVSEGIEPQHANVYVRDTAKGKFTIKNRQLEELLERKGMNTPETWQEIIKAGGSVQGVNFLNGHEKEVFKTFQEIDQAVVIQQAAERTPYIDQSQSLNLKIDPRRPAKEISDLHIQAWKQGVKTLYYQLGINAAQEFARELNSCQSCAL